MKRVSAILLGSLFLLISSSTTMAQKKEAMPAKMKAGAQKTMNWTTDTKAAREWAMKGANHLINAEFPQAYDYFSRASSLDPNFSEPLVFMAWMSVGQSKKDLAQKAIKAASNKPEAEKLMASIVDEKNTPESERQVWARLHDMYPDDIIIWSGFIQTRQTLDERFSAAQEFESRYPDVPFIHNMLGYLYMEKKDNDNAKKHFEKYIELYPDGYNPYDSMGEFYLNTGDLANAEKYYTMALEKYPFNSSSQRAMEKIRAEKKKNNPDEKKQ